MDGPSTREALIESHHQDGVDFCASPGEASALGWAPSSELQRRLAEKSARSIRIAPEKRPCGVARRLLRPTQFLSSRLACPLFWRQPGGAIQSELPWACVGGAEARRAYRNQGRGCLSSASFTPADMPEHCRGFFAQGRAKNTAVTSRGFGYFSRKKSDSPQQGAKPRPRCTAMRPKVR